MCANDISVYEVTKKPSNISYLLPICRALERNSTGLHPMPSTHWAVSVVCLSCLLRWRIKTCCYPIANYYTPKLFCWLKTDQVSQLLWIGEPECHLHIKLWIIVIYTNLKIIKSHGLCLVLLKWIWQQLIIPIFLFCFDVKNSYQI